MKVLKKFIQAMTSAEVSKYLDFPDGMLLILVFSFVYFCLTIKISGIFLTIMKLYLPLTLPIILIINTLCCFVLFKTEYLSTDILSEGYFCVLPFCFFCYALFYVKKQKQS